MDLIGTYTLVLVVYFDDLEQNQNIFAEFKIKINPPEYPSNLNLEELIPKTTFKIISVSAFEVSLRNSTLNIFSSEELPPSVIQIEAYVKDLKKTVLIA